MPDARPQVISILLHVTAILLLISISSRLSAPRRPVPVTRPVHLLAPRHRIAMLASSRPAGGGGETAAPPRHGALPAPAHRTFILPVSRTVEDPRLTMQPTMIEAPSLTVAAAPVGDPSGVLNGRGLGSGQEGIGYGCCGGAGDHDGAGYDGQSGRPATRPQLIYKVDPDFSEQARKARFEGTVVLSIEIDAKGRTSKIRVARGLGLGLDEKAEEAVAQWRFRPALRDGRPVAASALVEVRFHLL